jgi:hypothetical protein
MIARNAELVAKRGAHIACLLGACLAAISLVWGCNANVKPEPVRECSQYEAALDACFHRDSGFASQPSVLPKDDADRERIRSLCIENLERLPAACK